jgi:hypothetical protein
MDDKTAAAFSNWSRALSLMSALRVNSGTSLCKTKGRLTRGTLKPGCRSERHRIAATKNNDASGLVNFWNRESDKSHSDE